MRRLLTLAACCLALAGCKDDSIAVPWTRAWDLPIAVDRFQVNASIVVITRVEGTLSRLTSAVPAASLTDPVAVLAVDVYVPAEVGHTTGFDDLSVVVRRADGTSTANVVSTTASRLVDRVTIGDVTYSVLRIVGNLTGAGPVAPTAFESVTFGFRLVYEDPTGDRAHARDVTLEVQKQQ